MIASLSMYDWPAQSRHWDVLWDRIRDAMTAQGLSAPQSLTRNGRLWDHWESPDLVLGQTCGMPYRTRLHGRVALIGALDHGLPNAPAGYYYSILIVHRDAQGNLADFADRTLAYNGLDSESGWAAAQNTAMVHGFRFTRKLHTGSHRNSALAVARKTADIAAIDAETWRLIKTHMPGTADSLRILTQSAPTPGLPLISALGADAERLASAIEIAIENTDSDTLDALHIKGFVRTPATAYLAVRTPEMPSQDVPAA